MSQLRRVYGYEIEGKQYVTIVAGGGARRVQAPIRSEMGRTVHTFALPE